MVVDDSVQPISMSREGVSDLWPTMYFVSNHGYASAMRGKKLIFSVGWFDWSDSDSAGNRSRHHRYGDGQRREFRGR